jgi:hypothetical protein
LSSNPKKQFGKNQEISSKMPNLIGPDGGFNIKQFKSYRENMGVSRTHSYTVSFDSRPSVLYNVSNETFKNMEVMIDQTNFPALAMDTYGVQYYGYGPIVKRPTVPDYTPIQITIVDDNEATMAQTMSAWQRSIINYFGDDNNGYGAYEVGYLSEYSTTVRIRTYSPTAELIRETAFREAYPMVVGEIQYSWGRLNEIVKVPVVLVYTDWRDEQVAESTLVGSTRVIET